MIDEDSDVVPRRHYSATRLIVKNLCVVAVKGFDLVAKTIHERFDFLLRTVVDLCRGVFGLLLNLMAVVAAILVIPVCADEPITQPQVTAFHEIVKTEVYLAEISFIEIGFQLPMKVSFNFTDNSQCVLTGTPILREE